MQSLQELTRQHSTQMALILRAHRKRLGLEQREVSELLGIGQEKLSRLESGKQQVPHVVWHILCEAWGLPYDCFKFESVDFLVPGEFTNRDRIGKFRIPKRYSSHQGTAVRLVRLFLDYGSRELGDSQIQWFLMQCGFDPDYFVHLDHQVNLLFLSDLIEFLLKRTKLSTELETVFDAVSKDPALKGVPRRDLSTFHELTHDLIRSLRLYDQSFIIELTQEITTAPLVRLSPHPFVQSELRRIPEASALVVSKSSALLAHSVLRTISNEKCQFKIREASIYAEMH